MRKIYFVGTEDHKDAVKGFGEFIGTPYPSSSDVINQNVFNSILNVEALKDEDILLMTESYTAVAFLKAARKLAYRGLISITFSSEDGVDAYRKRDFDVVVIGTYTGVDAIVGALEAVGSAVDFAKQIREIEKQKVTV